MEARNGEFGTTMREVLQQRPGEAATYTHIECKIGGLRRAATGIGALTDWLRGHPQDSATYMFVNKVDYRTALGNIELEEEVVTDKPAQGKLFATKYSDWIRRVREPRNNEGKLVFVMDMGFGVRTGEMALAATAMLHSLQRLLRGEKTGTTVLWVSVSYFDEALLCQTSGRRVDGLLLPRFNEPRLCHQDQAHEKAEGPQSPDSNWQSAAVGRILQEVIKDAALPVAIAFVMSIEDAYLIGNELATHSQCPSLTMHFIHAWTGPQAAREAAASSQDLKIVYIDPEVSVICPIQDLKAVVVAPVLNAHAFDINTTSVVRKKVVCDLASALAASIRGTGLEGTTVHMVNGFSQPVPATNRLLIGSQEQVVGLSTASDRDFWHLYFATHAVGGDYPFQGLLSVVVPPRSPKLDEAQRRLDLWHLLDRSDLPPGIDPRAPRPPSQLAGPAARYAMAESNIHTIVLLAHTRRQLPSCVKQVLIDLAMLISQGPRSVFDHRGKAKGQREHREIIQGLGHRAGFAREHCHKGLLWQSLAYLNYFRNMTADAAWGPSGWLASKLDGVAMHHVLVRLLGRASRWRESLKVPREDQTQKLSGEDFALVEAILVSAFPFNLMIVHAEDVGHFGRDLTSEVILEEEAPGETVYWEVLKEEAKKSGQGLVMAIHTHLWMDTADDDLRVYRAIGATAISTFAFKTGLMYLGIDHFSSLRPLIRPERRCLVRKGESWSSRQVDSSQDTTSTSNNSA